MHQAPHLATLKNRREPVVVVPVRMGQDKHINGLAAETLSKHCAHMFATALCSAARATVDEDVFASRALDERAVTLPGVDRSDAELRTRPGGAS